MTWCMLTGLCSLLLAAFVDPVLSSVNCNGCAAPDQCVGNTNIQAVEDADCAPCAGPQTWWPCNVEGLCWCWDTSKPRVPPPPSSGLDFAAAAPCDVLTEERFNILTGGAQQAPYTYAGLCAAIDDYNRLHPTENVFRMGTLEQQKAELAAFLGNTLHESDGFKAAREYLPCGDFKIVNGKTYCKPCDSGNFDWATKRCRSSKVANGGAFTDYCDSARSPPGACSCQPVTQAGSDELAGYMEADKAFFGRGAIQLSWNYNYIRASTALTGSADTFCANPDLVATVEKYAWGAGIYFWMENMKTVQDSVGDLSTCHIQALSGEMGGTLWNINGNQECPATSAWHTKAVVMRTNHYCRAATVLGVASLLSFEGCKGMSEAYANCDSALAVEQGGCPDCATWKHASTSTASLTSTTATTSLRASTTATTVIDTTTIMPSTSSAIATSTTATTLLRTTTTTSTTTIMIDTTTIMSSTSAVPLTTTVASTTSTTRTDRNTQCVDASLPLAWSGGGVHTCLTYEQQGLAYCRHAELEAACCFCGGGVPEPTPSSTQTPMPETTTTSVEPTPSSTQTPMPETTTTSVDSQCTDGPLPVAWSAGGLHTCSTYEQHGGFAYCAHKELAEACCFCKLV